MEIITRKIKNDDYQNLVPIFHEWSENINKIAPWYLKNIPELNKEDIFCYLNYSDYNVGVAIAENKFVGLIGGKLVINGNRSPNVKVNSWIDIIHLWVKIGYDFDVIFPSMLNFIKDWAKEKNIQHLVYQDFINNKIIINNLKKYNFDKKYETFYYEI